MPPHSDERTGSGHRRQRARTSSRTSARDGAGDVRVQRHARAGPSTAAGGSARGVGRAPAAEHRRAQARRSQRSAHGTARARRPGCTRDVSERTTSRRRVDERIPAEPRPARSPRVAPGSARRAGRPRRRRASARRTVAGSAPSRVGEPCTRSANGARFGSAGHRAPSRRGRAGRARSRGDARASAGATAEPVRAPHRRGRGRARRVVRSPPTK